MGWFTAQCAHQWQPLNMFYAPPIANDVAIALAKSECEISTRELLGVTTYVFQCAKCSALYETEVIGQVVDKHMYPNIGDAT